MISENSRILVTGARGFVGRHVTQALKNHNFHNIFAPSSDEFDLTVMEQTKAAFEHAKPDVVIHLAAAVGGIGANRQNPGRFFFENAMMGLHVIETARSFEVQKTIVLGTICSYPKLTPVPFSEKNLWNGYPEETNAPYGIAKKAILVQGQAYRQQYGMSVIHLLSVNMYGPHDDFDLQNSHVIPAIIRKCHEAKLEGRDFITLWGDGSPTREFIYVADAAEAIVLAMINYDEPGPVNIGTGQEISIRDLTNKIQSVTEFDGEIKWDTEKPNGQPRRCLDCKLAQEKFGFVAKVGIDEGLRKTFDWYVSSLAHSAT